MSRKITIYNTIGDNAKEVISSAGTLGELQPDMRRAGVHYEGMKLVVGETQNTLESSEAVLPEGEFSLFLMAGKVKSGNDEDFIDDEDGIEWDQINWAEEGENVEDYTFLTVKDLMIARAKKASYYLDKVVEFMISNRNTNSSTTTAETTKNNALMSSLRAEAAKLQKNLDVFN